MQTTNYTHIGTPFIYQGTELGMVQPKDWRIEDYKDVETKTFYREYIAS
jgi:oligo-1,6-glucosidase